MDDQKNNDAPEFLDESNEPSGENAVFADTEAKGLINKGRPLPPVKTRWKKGQSGNPRGRPKKKNTLDQLLSDELHKICPTDPQKRKWANLLIQALFHHALKGDSTAAKLIWSCFGKSAKAGQESWSDSNTPSERTQLSKDAMNRIRDIYGLPHIEDETENHK